MRQQEIEFQIPSTHFAFARSFAASCLDDDAEKTHHASHCFHHGAIIVLSPNTADRFVDSAAVQRICSHRVWCKRCVERRRSDCDNFNVVGIDVIPSHRRWKWHLLSLLTYCIFLSNLIYSNMCCFCIDRTPSQHQGRCR